jgi:hypothetical protein
MHREPGQQRRARTAPLRVLIGGALVVGAWACTAPAIPDDTLRPLDGYPTRSARLDAGSQSEPSRGRSQPSGTQEDPPIVPEPAPSGSDAGAEPPPVVVDSGTPTPTNTCGGQATATACFQCCETNNPGTVQRWNNYFGQCACENPGVCAAQCANSFCGVAAPAPGSACDVCLSNATTCVQQADQRCLGDALCAPLVQCDRAAQCAAKP